MDRVVTLLEKLNNQVASQTGIDELMLTTQMILSELQHLKTTIDSEVTTTKVAIHISDNFETPEKELSTEEVIAEKEVLLLNVNDSDIEAELEQIKKNAETKMVSGLKNRPTIQFDPFEDVPPTPMQQQKIPQREVTPLKVQGEEGTSLNEALKQENKTSAGQLLDTPIKDLKKAIGINDRYLYINELFGGDETMYERSIKTINAFTIYPEAEYWIRRELKLKLAWDEKNEVVQQFDQLVRRRFSFT